MLPVKEITHQLLGRYLTHFRKNLCHNVFFFFKEQLSEKGRKRKTQTEILKVNKDR